MMVTLGSRQLLTILVGVVQETTATALRRKAPVATINVLFKILYLSNEMIFFVG